MTGRERVLLAFEHKEADRVPFDLGGMAQSGIHRIGYENVRRYLGLPDIPSPPLNIITQAAVLHDDFRSFLGIDTYLVYGKWADPAAANITEDGDYLVYTDEWSIERRMPKDGGLYYDIFRHPFDTDDWKLTLETFRWPDPIADERFEGLRKEANKARENGFYVVLMGLCPGIMEMFTWFRGFERFYTDLAAEPQVCDFFLGKMAKLKAAYWQRALEECGQYVDAVNEADDLAGQHTLLMSPDMYRSVIKPHHKSLFSAIKRASPDVKIIFHTCGAAKPLIGDLIEIGVDILNPIQTSAKDMDPKQLKKEFGSELCFWGGGIDTQHVLVEGTPEQIEHHVRQNIESLAPGGGFVFAPTHVYQADVPPKNFMVMWEAVQKYGKYS